MHLHYVENFKRCIAAKYYVKNKDYLIKFVIENFSISSLYFQNIYNLYYIIQQ